MVGSVSVVGGQTQRREKIYGFFAARLGVLCKSVQRYRLLMAIRRGALVDAEVCQLVIGKLHALDCVLTEGSVHLFVRNASGHIGLRIPNAVVLSPGQVVLVQGQGCAAAGVDGSRGCVGGRNAAGDGKSHDRGHGKGAESFQNVRFHG